MLASLSDSDKKMLLGWVTEFATEEIENEKSWNPRRSILSLAKLIQKEMYVSLYSKFDLDINVLTNYKRHLYGIIRKFESELKSVCDRAQGLLDTVPDGILIRFWGSGIRLCWRIG